MSGLKTLEHVAVTVSITHPRRGSLEVKLFCPSGMMSLIGAPRSMDSYVPMPSPGLFATRAFSRKRYRGRGPCLYYVFCGSAYRVLGTALSIHFL